VTAIIRDITERKQSEQRERALQESYMAELEMRHKDSESAALVKSEFMASVSHELRTPLHTIIGFSELLAEDSSGPLNAKQQMFLDHIRKDSEHLLGMINDVLELSRIEAGRLTVRTELMPLRPAVTEASHCPSSLCRFKICLAPGRQPSGSDRLCGSPASPPGAV
jgi:signal transduction histidine kinase